MKMNQSIIFEFHFIGYPSSVDKQIYVFLVLLLVYIVTILFNLFIVVLVCIDTRLQSPMYFFICNLSLVEICYISTTIPRMLSDLMQTNKGISLNECLTQFYFFFTFGSTEDTFLLSMALDRYLAICKPLQYNTIMTCSLSHKLACMCYVSGLVAPLIPLAMITRLTFCTPNGMDHFLCDFAPLLKLACTDTTVIRLIFFIFSSAFICCCSILISVSYIFIISAVLRIPSRRGRQKAFSTCSSHLTVVILLYCTAGFVYLRPARKELFVTDKLLTVFYSIGIPLANPLIYSLRNNDIKEAVKTLIQKHVKKN